MALLALSRRKRTPRLADHFSAPRLVKDVRDGLDLPTLPEIPSFASLSASLPELTEMVEAAIEKGSKRIPPLPAIRQRRRRGRGTARLVLLAAVIGGLVMAYRWWNGRRGDEAQLIDEPRSPGDSPSVTPPSPWGIPASALDRRDPAPGIASMSEPKTEDQVESGSESATEPADPTEPEATPRPWSTMASESAIADAPLRPARDEAVRPRPPMGRGIAPAAPSLPSRRPAMPGRPSSFHPR